MTSTVYKRRLTTVKNMLLTERPVYCTVLGVRLSVNCVMFNHVLVTVAGGSIAVKMDKISKLSHRK